MSTTEAIVVGAMNMYGALDIAHLPARARRVLLDNFKVSLDLSIGNICELCELVDFG
jgi:hypothetical protein